MKTKNSFIILIGLLSFIACKQQTQFPMDARSSIVVKTHPMDTIVSTTTIANWLNPPFKYWGIKNVDKLFDIGLIAKGETPLELESNPISFSDLIIEQFDGKMYGFEEHLDSNRTDGF
ncbi:MAG: hypothetical protein ACJA01_002182 [Saprospiraceae bacterium]|jgi:hypothetical protein